MLLKAQPNGLEEIKIWEQFKWGYLSIGMKSMNYFASLINPNQVKN